MFQTNFPALSVISLTIAIALALAASPTRSQQSVFERKGECGPPPLPNCNEVIDDANEQKARLIALQEALDAAVDNARSRARSNEVIVGIMPHGQKVVDTQWELLNVSDFSGSYYVREFRRTGAECCNGRVCNTDGFGDNDTLAHGWAGDFDYESTFIGRTELKVGGFGSCAVIVTFVFE